MQRSKERVLLDEPKWVIRAGNEDIVVSIGLLQPLECALLVAGGRVEFCSSDRSEDLVGRREML